MRFQSKKRASLMRKWGPVRLQFIEDYKFCWVCGDTHSLSCHEITRGIHRDAALSQRITWMVACWKCNSGVLTDATTWPLARQLALKWLYDLPHFDTKGICELMGRSPGCVVWDDIVGHVCRILDGGASV